MSSVITNLQKICDIRDWSDERIERIIGLHLRMPVTHQRRQWEHAMLYLALEQAGALKPDSIGHACGAGTEVLIYAVAEQVGKLIVTDLYRPDSEWVSVRTRDPKQHILTVAPFPIDPARIDVLDMDMREIKYPDNTFDFCYSTGSIEHIGADTDFIRHLNEVHRTLKEGGTYAFTTVILFADESSRIPGNHYFEPNHLLDLVDACPLHAAPVLDCSLAEMRLNRPIPDRLLDFGLASGSSFAPLVTSLRRGAVTAAVMLVLTKESARPKRRARIEGLTQSRCFVEASLIELIDTMWKEWQYLHPLAGITTGRTPSGPGSVNAKGEVLFRTQPHYYGSGEVSFRARVEASPPAGEGGTLNLMVVSQRRIWPLDKKIEAVEPVKVDASPTSATRTLTVRADPSRCYFMQARVEQGRVAYGDVAVHARRWSSSGGAVISAAGTEADEP